LVDQITQTTLDKKEEPDKFVLKETERRAPEPKKKPRSKDHAKAPKNKTTRLSCARIDLKRPNKYNDFLKKGAGK